MKEFMKMFNLFDGKVPGDFLSGTSPFPNKDFNMDQIQKYVQHSIEEALKPTQKAFPGSYKEGMKDECHSEVIELLNVYIVKIQLPPGVSVESVRITLKHNELFIDGVEEGRKVVTLPKVPSKRNISAEFKEGTIEIRLHKKVGGDEKEIYVHY